MGDAVLDIKNLSKRYNSKWALKNINLRLDKGRIDGLIGKNGAGIYDSSKEYLEICISHTNEMEKRVQQFFEYSYWSGMEEDVELQRINITNLVKDGCGIDASKVFNRFYVGNEERNHSTGLGLSIVKLLVERMGGEVFAQMDGGMFCIGFTLLSAK